MDEGDEFENLELSDDDIDNVVGGFGGFNMAQMNQNFEELGLSVPGGVSPSVS